jgi:hypothetical protein
MSKFRLLLGLLLLPILVLSSRSPGQTRVSSDGTDFIFGMPPIMNGSPSSSYTIYAYPYYSVLLCSYDSSIAILSYFDSTGREFDSDTVTVTPQKGATIPLNGPRLVSSPLTRAYKGLHLRSTKPVSAQLLTQNSMDGELALLLPTNCLGRNYMAAALTTVPGITRAFYSGIKNLEGRSLAYVIASADSTKVRYRIAKAGKSSGIYQTISLNRGQVYLIVADTNSSTSDISGTVIESDHPIAVFAANNQPRLPLISIAGTEQVLRNPVMEEMIPRRAWDSTGYVSIPFLPPQNGVRPIFGIGADLYRIFGEDTSIVNLVTQIADSMPSLQAGFIEKPLVADPISIFSSRGAPISVEQYDYMAIDTDLDPLYYTMSCSMNIIPISQWKRQYAWVVPTDSYFRGGAYINVISKAGSLNGIKFLHTGTAFLPVPLATYSIPGHASITGWTIRVPSGAFTATSDSDFIVYSYGRTEGSRKSGYAYAAPCGQLFDAYNSHLGSATIVVDTLCRSFEIHVHDSRPSFSHVKSIVFTTDGATAKQLGILQSKNVKLLNNPSYRDSDIFISVGFLDPSLPATAIIYIIDGDGIPDSEIVVLQRAADPVKTIPSNLSIRVLQGLDTCANATISYSALATHPLIISDIHFAVGTPFTYTIPSPLPITLQPGENLVITICGKVTDVNIAHLDTLIFGDGCSTRIPLSITGLAARINWDHDSSSLSLQCGDPDTIRVWLQNNSASHAQEIVELVDIEGVDKSEFTIVANQKGYTTLTNFPLDYGEKMWIDIAFAPDMTKPLAIRWNDRQAFIVAKNALHSDPVINLTAHVTRGLISTSEQVIDFGILPLQTPTTLTLNVSNSGNAPIRVSKILTTAPYVSVTGIAVGDLLLPGASVTISVTASAQSASLDSETIEIWGDGICTPPATLGVKLQGASTIHGVSVLSTSTGFPPTYTCASSSATAQIKNLGPDSLHVIRYSIKYSSDHPDTNAFTLSDDSRSRSIDLWLSKDSSFSTLIKYHPRLAGSHSAIFEYTWDSSGVILTEDIVLFGSSTMLQSGLSESVGNVDTVLRASVENVIAIPIVLNTAIPTEAKVQAISIRAAFGEDLFHFVSVQPAAGYTLTNSSLQNQNGRSYLSASFSSAVAVVNPGNICEVMLEPLVAKNDTSDFEIASVTYFTNTGDTICAEIATHVALIQVASLCADSLLRVGLKGDKLTLYGVSPNPATNQITITSASQKNDVIQISIRDLLGRELTTQRLVATGNTQTSQLDISGIREGTYLLEMKSVNGRAIRRVVVLR